MYSDFYRVSFYDISDLKYFKEVKNLDKTFKLELVEQEIKKTISNIKQIRDSHRRLNYIDKNKPLSAEVKSKSLSLRYNMRNIHRLAKFKIQIKQQ